MSDECYHVQHDPNAKKDALDDDEAPRTNCFSDPVSKHRARRRCELG